MQQARKDVLRKAGMCITHPTEPVVEGSTRCQKCRDNAKVRDEKAKAVGMCPRHTNEPSVEGHSSCQKCLDNAKVRYEKLIAAGMCPVHSNEPLVMGLTRCQKCLDYAKTRLEKLKTRGMCTRCLIEPTLDGHALCRKCLDEGKLQAEKIKLEVFKHYSGDEIPYCACCGENNYEFLTVDHIDGGGAQHRRENGYHPGNSTYSWILKNNFPEGFRILCWNCNSSRGVYGYCPHEKQRELEDETTLAQFNLYHSKIPIPTDLPQPSAAQLSLDGGHF